MYQIKDLGKTTCRKKPKPCTSCQSFLIVLVTLLILIFGTDTAPIQTEFQAMNYLSQFGYILTADQRTLSDGLDSDANILYEGIREFQRFIGASVTGEFDDETKKIMSLPRCGVKDKNEFSTDNDRQLQYVIAGDPWLNKTLTYKISKYTKHLMHEDVNAEISRAFNFWSNYTDLTFNAKESGNVDIEIKFVEDRHGDFQPFDGPGHVLAHAAPPVNGDAHFDDSEHWTIGSTSGTNLLYTAVHEFGHSMGLKHSDVKSAVMYPIYSNFNPSLQLDLDDILGIQALYGKKTNNLCKNPKIDALFHSLHGTTYVLKGEEYYKLTNNSIADGYPKYISEGWPGLPGNIDAAYTFKDNKTYFFKDTKYWRYSGRQLDSQYPKNISDDFPGIPTHLDTALFWGLTGKIYFFKNSQFWRFDPLTRKAVLKSISNLRGLSNKLDAALQDTNGSIFFFKDKEYYRFNENTFSIYSDDPPYPRLSEHLWFGCKSIPS